MQIDVETKIISSIASKQTNLGAVMHNAAYQYLKANIVYIPFTVSDCKNAISGVRALNFIGSTVSMPYKQEVINYLDKIDEVAREIGAVNCILNENGNLTGYNSDWVGAMEAIKERTELNEKTVVLIGGGGAARAIAYGLKKNKAKTIIFNRTAKKAKEIAEKFNIEFGGDLEKVKKVADYDILINATSIGFYPDTNSVLDASSLKENKIVLDVVMKPLETTFQKIAKQKNCLVIPGYRMLIYQALFQVEMFTGKKAPFKIMEKALLEVLK